jgi:hypothetical protein
LKIKSVAKFVSSTFLFLSDWIYYKIGNNGSMELERYDIVEGKDGQTFDFYSNGPKGRIRKAVKFQHRPELGSNVYNLSLGDYEEGTNMIDDSVVSNNGDPREILVSVGFAVDKFVNSHPRAIILIKGSTASRTRLYQMGIASAWLEIKERCEVWGRRADEWSPFEKGINYEEFLVFKNI